MGTVTCAATHAQKKQPPTISPDLRKKFYHALDRLYIDTFNNLANFVQMLFGICHFVGFLMQNALI